MIAGADAATALDGREDFLRAYVSAYLTEEIKAESLVRNLGSFSRFLEVAALAAGRRSWPPTRPTATSSALGAGS